MDLNAIINILPIIRAGRITIAVLAANRARWRINGIERRIFTLDLDDLAHFESTIFLPLGLFEPGIHSLTLETISSATTSSCTLSVYFAVFGPSGLLDSMPFRFECPGLSSSDFYSHLEHVPNPQTYTESKWWNSRLCLEHFLSLYPTHLIGSIVLGRMDEGLGIWASAASYFQQALHIYHITTTNFPVSKRLLQFVQYAEEGLNFAEHMLGRTSQAPNCTWRTVLANTRYSNAQRLACPSGDGAPRISQVADLEAEGTLYLSIIMTFRHDDGEYCNLPPDSCLDRIRAALTLLTHLLAKHGLASDAEIILVEWNPCHSRAAAPCRPRRGGYLRAADAVRRLVRAPAQPVTVRVIEVPEAVHARVHNPHGYDHLEHHGKNAGARRARGRFLAFTNPDNLWPEPLVERLARRDLRPDAFYSADRRDVVADAPPGADPAALLRHFERASVVPMPADVAAAAGVVAAGVPAAGSGGGFRRAACLAGDDEEPAPPAAGGAPPPPALHSQAAGDFLLAPRRAVAAARGAPEVPTNAHVDTMTVFALAAHGFGQLVLRQPCGPYHQHHSRSPGQGCRREVLPTHALTAILLAILAAGSEANRRPAGSEERGWARWNEAGWGLAGEELPETRMVASCAGEAFVCDGDGVPGDGPSVTRLSGRARAS